MKGKNSNSKLGYISHDTHTMGLLALSSPYFSSLLRYVSQANVLATWLRGINLLLRRKWIIIVNDTLDHV